MVGNEVRNDIFTATWLTNQGGPTTDCLTSPRPGVISEIATEPILYEKQLSVLRCKGFDLLVCPFINNRL
jgi:hypothetical protein